MVTTIVTTDFWDGLRAPIKEGQFCTLSGGIRKPAVLPVARRYSQVATNAIIERIGAPRVIVPFGADVGSAIGLLRAVPKIEVSVTRVMEVEDGNVGAMRAIHDDLELRTATDLERLSVAGETVWSRSGYLR